MISIPTFYCNKKSERIKRIVFYVHNFFHRLLPYQPPSRQNKLQRESNSTLVTMKVRHSVEIILLELTEVTLWFCHNENLLLRQLSNGKHSENYRISLVVFFPGYNIDSSLPDGSKKL